MHFNCLYCLDFRKARFCLFFLLVDPETVFFFFLKVGSGFDAGQKWIRPATLLDHC